MNFVFYSAEFIIGKIKKPVIITGLKFFFFLFTASLTLNIIFFLFIGYWDWGRPAVKDSLHSFSRRQSQQLVGSVLLQVGINLTKNNKI